MPHGLGRGGKPAGIPQERPHHRRHQRADPEQLAGQGLAAGLAAGKRRDLGVHRAELGLQVIHPAQRDRDRLRPGGRQPHPGAVGGQPGAQLRVAEPPGQAGHALVEQGGVDPLGPGGVLLGQVAVQLQQRPQLAHLPGRDPRQRYPPVGHQDPKVAGIGPVGFRVPLGTAQVRGLGRLGQQRGDPRPLQLLHHELPPRTALHRERHVRTAREPLQPVPQRFPAGRRDPAPPHLTGHGVQIVEGDLSTVDVKPSYDGHYRDLLTLLKCADALSVR